MKKFLVLPTMLILYCCFWYFVFPNIRLTIREGNETGMAVLNVGEGISVSVTRTYFGFLELPVSTSIGDVRAVHNAFFVILYVVLIAMIVFEYWNRRVRFINNTC